jgi:hypothetical protein
MLQPFSSFLDVARYVAGPMRGQHVDVVIQRRLRLILGPRIVSTPHGGRGHDW